jgi:Flp pilus assembly protein TadB
MDRTHETPTLGDVLAEIMDQTAGLTVMLLPLLTIALPGVILLLLAPIVLLAAAVAIPAVLVGALLGPPWLVVRMVRRHRARG